MAGHTALPDVANMPVAAGLTALPFAANKKAQRRQQRRLELVKVKPKPGKKKEKDRRPAESGAGAKPVAAGLAALPFAALPSRPKRQALRRCPKSLPTAKIAQVRQTYWQGLPTMEKSASHQKSGVESSGKKNRGCALVQIRL